MVRLIPGANFTEPTPGRYEVQSGDSMILTERSVKEPLGLDQAMLDGNKKKKRVRRVSNLSLNLVEEDKQNRSSLFKSKSDSL